eukprot:9358463-Pyramimonas_sp.AAC.2
MMDQIWGVEWRRIEHPARERLVTPSVGSPKPPVGFWRHVGFGTSGPWRSRKSFLAGFALGLAFGCCICGYSDNGPWNP